MAPGSAEAPTTATERGLKKVCKSKAGPLSGDAKARAAELQPQGSEFKDRVMTTEGFHAWWGQGGSSATRGARALLAGNFVATFLPKLSAIFVARFLPKVIFDT